MTVMVHITPQALSEGRIYHLTSGDLPFLSGAIETLSTNLTSVSGDLALNWQAHTSLQNDIIALSASIEEIREILLGLS